VCLKCAFQYYLLMQPDVKPVNGDKLIDDIKIKMERMIQKRVEAVRVILQLYTFLTSSIPSSFVYR